MNQSTFNGLTFNDLTGLTNLIPFLILPLWHTVSKICINGLLNILTDLFTLSDFKKRVYDEYILALRVRRQYDVKKTNNHPILKINDTVLLKEDQPRIKWRKGKTIILSYGYLFIYLLIYCWQIYKIYILKYSNYATNTAC